MRTTTTLTALLTALLTTLLITPPAAAELEFFAFQNGVHFGSDEKAAVALKEIGYSGIGSANIGGLERRIATYRKHGLKVHSIYVGATLQRGTPGVLDPKIIEAMGLLDDTAVVEFTLRGNPTDEEAAVFMRQVADEAAKHELDVVLYPHAHFFVDTVDDGVRIAKLAKRDNLGVMFNLCHFLKVEPNADLEQTLRQATPWIKQVSTSGAKVGGKSWGELIQPLNRGDFDQEALFDLLDELEFDGKVGLQCYAIKGDARTNLTNSLQAWRAIRQPHLVMLIAEREYKTKDTLPAFAAEHLADFKVTSVFEDPDDRNRFAGMEAVREADVLLVSVRRRTLPPEQLALVREHVAAGKPLLGIRTASHAFAIRKGKAPEGRALWQDFDATVLGGNYQGHYGNPKKDGPQVMIARTKTNHPILKGLSPNTFRSGGSLYKTKPIDDDTTLLLSGTFDGKPAEPVAWTHIGPAGGKVFYTSLGHVEDFAAEPFQRLLKNAVRWSVTDGEE